MKATHVKYNLVTATATVIGAVIGSGVFFKAEWITRLTGGNIFTCVMAWGTGAAVMLLCLFAFSGIAKTDAQTGGLYLITKTHFKGTYSRFVGLFMAFVYYPSLVGVLSYLCVRYALLSAGIQQEALHILLSALLIVITFMYTAYLPQLSGKIQVITTILKLVPLFLMIVLGTANGINTGILRENLSPEGAIPFKDSFFASVTATLFAYEGWISVTGIGKNLHNSKKNLPVALLLGGFVISAVYILYYIGIMGAVGSKTLINYGADGIKIAFSNVAGRFGGLLTVFVSISCFGALGAVTMGSVNANGELSDNSRRAFLLGIATCLFWLLRLSSEQKNPTGRFYFDSTELPVVTIYALYIPIFFRYAKKEKRKIGKAIYIGGITASGFAFLCGVLAHLEDLMSYVCILVAIIMVVSLLHKKTG